MGMGSFFQAAGYVQLGKAAKAKGRMTKQAKQFEADQARVNAGQALAAGQYGAIEQQRQARIVNSRIQALVAAGGGGTMDPTVVGLIGDQAGEGAYRAALELYEGENKARTLRMQAEASEFEGATAEIMGEMEQDAYNLQAIGALADGASSMAGGGR